MGSFREFLDNLKGYNEINTVEEQIDWDLEAAAICTMSQRVGGPAVLFSNVKDYPNMLLTGAVFSGPGFYYWPQEKRLMHGRMAVALDLEPDTHYEEFVETILDRGKAPIRAIEVESGSSQQLVIDDVDLYSYPIPRLHEKDGGRYLTSHIMLHRDQENGWTNLNMEPLMLYRRNMLVRTKPSRQTMPSQSEVIIEKYHRQNKPAPFAIVIGAPPALTMTARFNNPPGADEYGFAGGLGLKPLILVKAKLSDILVPADAEMILEGHVYPGDMAEGGPFPSLSFYEEKKEGYVYRVECITQRRDAILPFSVEGVKSSDSMCLLSLMHSAQMLNLLRTNGIPAKWMTMPVEAKLSLGVVALHSPQPVPGLPGRAAHLVFGKSPYIRQMIFVDNDVDPQDFTTSVLTDKIYKASFQRNYFVSPQAEKPLGLTENHDFNSGLTSTAFIDATWRLDRAPETIPRRINFEVCFPEDVKNDLLRKWNKELKLTPKAW
ncbi:MAG: Phenolic acid decarboxylase subunit C [Syntrophorhabdus sp. PtaU1.Bin050]|nr:MAG: Phenolic acid decarboxylase subunit C [Syntrophorhabdus sp. PtaU1.Bin050]